MALRIVRRDTRVHSDGAIAAQLWFYIYLGANLLDGVSRAAGGANDGRYPSLSEAAAGGKR
jgi:hypothetical protein